MRIKRGGLLFKLTEAEITTAHQEFESLAGGGVESPSHAAPPFADVTAQGYIVMERHVRRNGQLDVLCLKKMMHGDTEYAVGYGYDAETGSWSNGAYRSSLEGAAEAWAEACAEAYGREGDLSNIPKGSLVVELPDGYATAEPSGAPGEHPGVRVSIYGTDGSFLSDVCLFEHMEPGSKLGGDSDYMLRTWQLGSEVCDGTCPVAFDAADIAGLSEGAAKVEVVSCGVSTPCFNLYLPAGTDFAEWSERPDAVEVLKAKAREAIDAIGDAGCFECYDACTDTVDASEVAGGVMPV